jgi:succinate dehydrogenase/fumarate reductase flavoprotein subunit
MKIGQEKWSEEADVVVVGYGGAGAAVAITAHDAGSKVLILERAPKGEEGGNTRSSGLLQIHRTKPPLISEQCAEITQFPRR